METAIDEAVNAIRDLLKHGIIASKLEAIADNLEAAKAEFLKPAEEKTTE